MKLIEKAIFDFRVIDDNLLKKRANELITKRGFKSTLFKNNMLTLFYHNIDCLRMYDFNRDTREIFKFIKKIINSTFRYRNSDIEGDEIYDIINFNDYPHYLDNLDLNVNGINDIKEILSVFIDNSFYLYVYNLLHLIFKEYNK